MSRWVKVVLCTFTGCDPHLKSCVCKRCGRTNHLWVEMPQVESADFDFRGINAKGQMVYTETVHHQYNCSRCEEEKSTITRKHVHH